MKRTVLRAGGPALAAVLGGAIGLAAVLGGAIGLAVVTGLALGPAAHAAEPLKVGYIYVGPISDHGWSYQHNQGRLAVEAHFGDQVETSYVESVSEGADAARVIESLVASGHKLIFTTSFGFMNATVQVARRHPDVKFEHATGYRTLANLATYNARFYEGRHIAGLIAGHMTKSNVIGYIGSHPIPEVYRGINAFTLALRKVNPEATVRVIWVNSWYNPGAEAAAAKALIDQGADVLLQHTDSPAAIQVASERGVWAVGQSSDMTRFGPEVHLTAIVDDWSRYYIERVQAVLDGTWSSEDTWGGFAHEMIDMAPYNPRIPEDVRAQARQAREEIIAGTRHPFAGPIRDRTGRLIVGEGERMNDEDLLRMDYYVEGVIGRQPE